MEQIPSETISIILRYSPTLDLGRMMRVSRQFNQVLMNTPSLWRVVDLEEGTPKKNGLEIISVFASRSQNTLEIISNPEPLEPRESTKLFGTLERSKATLRVVQIDPDLYPEEFELVVKALISFPRIETLNITDNGFVMADGPCPGKLTALVLNRPPLTRFWLQEELNKLSFLKVLDLGCIDTDELERSLRSILHRCNSTLEELIFAGDWRGTPLECSFPKLKTLVSGPWTDFGNFFAVQPPNLETLVGAPKVLSDLKFKDLENLCFYVASDQEQGGPESSLSSLKEMFNVCKDSISTLKTIRLLSLRGASTYDIDYFLLALTAAPVNSTFLPLLSHLFIHDRQVYSSILLAEVMVSRNLAARSKGEEGFLGSCSEVILHLGRDYIERFRNAEQQVLSKYPEKIAKIAGLSRVEEWKVNME